MTSDRQVADYTALFLDTVPLLDVRSPAEFSRGAFPGAVNIPLMNDGEREQVGVCFSQSGQQCAIELGHRLVSGEIRERRIRAWCDFARLNPAGCLYCFRGGLRSAIVQRWMAEAGMAYPRISGGYKAMRRFLINALDETAAMQDFIVIGGKAGCGKTRIMAQLDNAVDLEGLANHRGSAFGHRVTGQPVQINFENALAIALMKLRKSGSHVYLEDESNRIGANSIPLTLFNKMQESPVAVLEETLANRVEVILSDYITENFREFTAANKSGGHERFRTYLLGSLQRIERRLGGLLYREIASDVEQALAHQYDSGDTSGHKVWIEKLLKHYYDPMYDYQLDRKQQRIIFRGSRDEFLEWSITHGK